VSETPQYRRNEQLRSSAFHVKQIKDNAAAMFHVEHGRRVQKLRLKNPKSQYWRYCRTTMTR
jgi:hypothetical protein